MRGNRHVWVRSYRTESWPIYIWVVSHIYLPLWRHTYLSLSESLRAAHARESWDMSRVSQESCHMWAVSHTYLSLCETHIPVSKRVTACTACKGIIVLSSCIWNMCETWLVYTRDMTRLYVWYNSSIYAICLLYISARHALHLEGIRDMTFWYMWHDSFI